MSIIDDRDYALAVRSCHTAAEIARTEGEALRSHGFEVVVVTGLDRLLWRKGERFYTTEYALAQIHAIPESKGEK